MPKRVVPFFKGINDVLAGIYNEYLPLAKKADSNELDLPKSFSANSVKKSGIPHREEPDTYSQTIAVYLEKLAVVIDNTHLIEVQAQMDALDQEITATDKKYKDDINYLKEEIKKAEKLELEARNRFISSYEVDAPEAKDENLSIDVEGFKKEWEKASARLSELKARKVSAEAQYKVVVEGLVNQYKAYDEDLSAHQESLEKANIAWTDLMKNLDFEEARQDLDFTEKELDMDPKPGKISNYDAWRAHSDLLSLRSALKNCDNFQLYNEQFELMNEKSQASDAFEAHVANVFDPEFKDLSVESINAELETVEMKQAAVFKEEERSELARLHEMASEDAYGVRLRDIKEDPTEYNKLAAQIKKLELEIKSQDEAYAEVEKKTQDMKNDWESYSYEGDDPFVSLDDAKKGISEAEAAIARFNENITAKREEINKQINYINEELPKVIQNKKAVVKPVAALYDKLSNEYKEFEAKYEKFNNRYSEENLADISSENWVEQYKALSADDAGKQINEIFTTGWKEAAEVGNEIAAKDFEIEQLQDEFNLFERFRQDANAKGYKTEKELKKDNKQAKADVEKKYDDKEKELKEEFEKKQDEIQKTIAQYSIQVPDQSVFSKLEDPKITPDLILDDEEEDEKDPEFVEAKKLFDENFPEFKKLLEKQGNELINAQVEAEKSKLNIESLNAKIYSERQTLDQKLETIRADYENLKSKVIFDYTEQEQEEIRFAQEVKKELNFDDEDEIEVYNERYLKGANLKYETSLANLQKECDNECKSLYDENEKNLQPYFDEIKKAQDKIDLVSSLPETQKEEREAFLDEKINMEENYTLCSQFITYANDYNSIINNYVGKSRELKLDLIKENEKRLADAKAEYDKELSYLKQRRSEELLEVDLSVANNKEITHEKTRIERRLRDVERLIAERKTNEYTFSKEIQAYDNTINKATEKLNAILEAAENDKSIVAKREVFIKNNAALRELVGKEENADLQSLFEKQSDIAKFEYIKDKYSKDLNNWVKKHVKPAKKKGNLSPEQIDKAIKSTYEKGRALDEIIELRKDEYLNEKTYKFDDPYEAERVARYRAEQDVLPSLRAHAAENKATLTAYEFFRMVKGYEKLCKKYENAKAIEKNPEKNPEAFVAFADEKPVEKIDRGKNPVELREHIDTLIKERKENLDKEKKQYVTDKKLAKEKDGRFSKVSKFVTNTIDYDHSLDLAEEKWFSQVYKDKLNIANKKYLMERLEQQHVGNQNDLIKFGTEAVLLGGELLPFKFYDVAFGPQYDELKKKLEQAKSDRKLLVEKQNKINEKQKKRQQEIKTKLEKFDNDPFKSPIIKKGQLLKVVMDKYTKEYNEANAQLQKLKDEEAAALEQYNAYDQYHVLLNGITINNYEEELKRNEEAKKAADSDEAYLALKSKVPVYEKEFADLLAMEQTEEVAKKLANRKQMLEDLHIAIQDKYDSLHNELFIKDKALAIVAKRIEQNKQLMKVSEIAAYLSQAEITKDLAEQELGQTIADIEKDRVLKKQNLDNQLTIVNKTTADIQKLETSEKDAAEEKLTGLYDDLYKLEHGEEMTKLKNNLRKANEKLEKLENKNAEIDRSNKNKQLVYNKEKERRAKAYYDQDALRAKAKNKADEAKLKCRKEIDKIEKQMVEVKKQMHIDMRKKQKDLESKYKLIEKYNTLSRQRNKLIDFQKENMKLGDFYNADIDNQIAKSKFAINKMHEELRRRALELQVKASKVTKFLPDSKEYKAMIKALDNCAKMDENVDLQTVGTLIAQAKAAAATYIKERNDDWFQTSGLLRKSRLSLAEDIYRSMELSINNYNKVSGSNLENDIPKYVEKNNKVKQLVASKEGQYGVYSEFSNLYSKPAAAKNEEQYKDLRKLFAQKENNIYLKEWDKVEDKLKNSYKTKKEEYVTVNLRGRYAGKLLSDEQFNINKPDSKELLKDEADLGMIHVTITSKEFSDNDDVNEYTIDKFDYSTVNGQAEKQKYLDNKVIVIPKDENKEIQPKQKAEEKEFTVDPVLQKMFNHEEKKENAMNVPKNEVKHEDKVIKKGEKERTLLD